MASSSGRNGNTPLSQAELSAAENQFRQDLAERNVALRGPLQYGLRPDGNWPRGNALNKKGKSGSGDAQYIFNVDGWPRWTIINYTDGQGFRSGYYNKPDMTPDERALADQAIELSRKLMAEENEKEAKRWVKVAERCRERWEAAGPAEETHGYLLRKNIRPHGVRQEGDKLLIPLIGPDGLIWSLQTIPSAINGKKIYAPGGKARDGFYTIGGAEAPPIIYITEGFATGATVAELTNAPVLVAFDCNKLRLAGERARRTWPNAKIVFAADDDWKTEGNPGLTKAVEAALEVSGLVAVPVFPEDGRGDKDTDFNDMRRVQGDAATLEALLNARSPDRVEVDILASMASDDDPLPPQYSESAIAKIFADRYKDTLRFVPKLNRWYKWNGSWWKHDEKLETWHMARLVCTQVASRIKTGTLARAVASAKTRRAVIDLASNDPLLATTADQWDADPWLLGTPDGTVELRTGTFREPRQEDYITKVTAISPDPEMPIPMWLEFLNRVLVNDQDLIDYTQRAAGYIATGVIIEHAMFFLYGQGGNGKSKFWECIAGILKDYHTSAVIETFTETPGDRHPTEMAKLAGARLVTSVETEQGRRWNESRITSSTGGDKISARFMRQDFFDFVPMFKLMVIGNYKPGLKSVSQAMRRRLQMWPFNYKITDDEKDLAFGDKLEAEWPGILWWMIQGCLAWQREKLAPPAAVIDTTEEYFASENITRQWIDDCCLINEDVFQASTILFASFEAWAKRRGEWVGSLKKFVQRLETEGFRPSRRVDEQTGDKVRGFWGILVRPAPDQQQVPSADAPF